MSSELDQNTRLIYGAVADRVARLGCPDADIVDLGCGEGLLLSILRARGYDHLTGVGYRIQASEGIRLVDGVDLSSPGWSQRFLGHQFDCLISTEVLEHLTNPYQFLVEARVIAKPTAQLILTFPNVHNLRSIVAYALLGRFSGFFGPNFNAGHALHDQHIFVPNLHLVRYFLGLAGFAEKEISYVNGRGRLFSQTTLLVGVPIERARIA